METDIINRVAQSPLLTLDLETLYPTQARTAIDLSQCLYEGLILREKDFRAWIAAHDWAQYADKLVAVYCSTDAIVPTWAYMLVGVRLAPHARKVVLGDMAHLDEILIDEALQQLNVEDYRGKKVVVKGCSKYPVPAAAYLKVATMLQPIVSSLMFGEPCSTVPVYKAPKTQE